MSALPSNIICNVLWELSVRASSPYGNSPPQSRVWQDRSLRHIHSPVLKVLKSMCSSFWLTIGTTCLAIGYASSKLYCLCCDVACHGIMKRALDDKDGGNNKAAHIMGPIMSLYQSAARCSTCFTPNAVCLHGKSEVTSSCSGDDGHPAEDQAIISESLVIHNVDIWDCQRFSRSVALCHLAFQGNIMSCSCQQVQHRYALTSPMALFECYSRAANLVRMLHMHIHADRHTYTCITFHKQLYYMHSVHYIHACTHAHIHTLHYVTLHCGTFHYIVCNLYLYLYLYTYK